MRGYKVVYVAAVILTGVATIAVAAAYPAHDVVVLTLGTAVLQVLTFPLGAVASVISFLPVFLGFMTATESLFLMAPAYAALGYIQWFRLLPAIYRRGQ